MAARNFDELRSHAGHTVTCMVDVDEQVGIENAARVYCVDCDETLVLYESNEDCVEWSVWVLTVLDPSGTEVYYFAREDVAERQLYEYVKMMWGRVRGGACPRQASKAIDDFFGDHEEYTYTLIEQPILCDVEWREEKEDVRGEE